MCGESARIRFSSSCGGRVQSSSRSSGRDLLRVRHALVGLRREAAAPAAPRRAARRRARRPARTPRRRRPPARSGTRCCAAIGPASSSSHELDGSSRPSPSSPAMHRALDRRGAAPARQQRRVHVEPQSAARAGLGDQHTVGDDDDRRPTSGSTSSSRSGWRTGMPEPLRRLLRRRRRELPPAPARTVGPRQQERDVVLRGEPLEHVRSERRRRGDRRAPLSGRRRAAAAASRAPRAAPRRSCGRGSARRRGGRARAATTRAGSSSSSSRTSFALRVPALDRHARRAARPGRRRPAARGSPRRRVSRSSPSVDDDVGLTSATGSSSASGWKTNTRCRTPTCVAASPTPVRVAHQLRHPLDEALRGRRRTPRPRARASAARGPGTGGSARARAAAAPRASASSSSVSGPRRLRPPPRSNVV